MNGIILSTLQVHRLSEQVAVRQGVGQHHRLRRDAVLLHRLGAAKVRLAPGERRYFGILLHHPHHEAVQVDASLVRPQDPHSDVPRIRQGIDAARLLPHPRHRHLRLSRTSIQCFFQNFFKKFHEFQ